VDLLTWTGEYGEVRITMQSSLLRIEIHVRSGSKARAGPSFIRSLKKYLYVDLSVSEKT
jgi:hypothetical protein